MAGEPLISCLMVSRGYAFPAEFAMECYRHQTYSNRELVVVSAQPNSQVEKVVARLGDPTIRFIQADDVPLGDLRNASVDAAQGSLLCLWDDDDLYHPRRLEFQARALLETGASAHFLKRIMLWWPDRNLLAVTGERPWENTMLARREALPRYPSVGIREDTVTIAELARTAPIEVTDDPNLYCYIVHGRNTSDEAQFEFLLDGADRVLADYEGELARLSDYYPLARYREALTDPERTSETEGANHWGGIVDIIQNRSFGQEDLRIDGTKFVDCTFHGTNFTYLGGSVPVFENCTFGDLTFELLGSARNTVLLIRKLRDELGIISGV